jgi:putative membrane protein
MQIRTCLVILFFAVALAACGKSGVQAARDSDLTPEAILSLDDQKFLDAAERAEIRENTLADQALERSTNLRVRALATSLHDDLGAALTELKNLMKTKHMAEPAVFAEEVHSEAANRLTNASGDAFDHEFVSLLTADGQDTLRIFDSAAQTAADPDVRTYANRVLPSLRANYNKASDLENKLAGKPGQ